jgi:hypothetical protein
MLKISDTWIAGLERLKNSIQLNNNEELKRLERLEEG